MPLRLITAPASEPVTQLEAETHLRLQPGDDLQHVADTIAAATLFVESYCNRKLFEQTWELVLPGFLGEDTLELGSRNHGRYPGFGFTDPATRPGELPFIELPLGRIGSVTSIKYIDVNGAEQTLGASVYTVDTASEPGRLMLAYNQDWPETRSPQWDAVKIRYTAGWPAASGAWTGPASLKRGLLMAIAHLYDNRGAVVIGNLVSNIPYSMAAVLEQHRLLRL